MPRPAPCRDCTSPRPSRITRHLEPRRSGGSCRPLPATIPQRRFGTGLGITAVIEKIRLAHGHSQTNGDRISCGRAPSSAVDVKRPGQLESSLAGRARRTASSRPLLETVSSRIRARTGAGESLGFGSTAWNVAPIGTTSRSDSGIAPASAEATEKKSRSGQYPEVIGHVGYSSMSLRPVGLPFT